MPHRKVPFLTLLLLIASVPMTVFPQAAAPAAGCAGRNSLLLDACKAIEKNDRDGAIDILKDFERHCRDGVPVARAARSWLEIDERVWEASDAIRANENHRAVKLLQEAAFHYPDNLGPIAGAAEAYLTLRDEARVRDEARERRGSNLKFTYKVAFAVFVPLVLAAYIYGMIRSRPLLRSRGRFPLRDLVFWFWPPKLARRQQSSPHTFRAALFVALTATLISLLFLRVLDAEGTHFLLSSPGALFVITVSLATFWSLGNTLVIAARQRSTFVRFRQFHRELDWIHESVRQREGISATGGGREEVYIIDYSPLIGHISDPETAKHIANTLGEFRSRNHCETHMLVLPEDDLRGFYEPVLRQRGLRDGELSLELSRLMAEVDRTYQQIDMERLAVWRSKKIHSEHYVVSADEGLQYIVIPQKDGTQNQLMGETTYDVNRIEFLRHTALDYLREAVSPMAVKVGGELRLSFNTNQENVSRIDLFFADEEGEFSNFEDLGCDPEDYERVRREEKYATIDLPDQRIREGTYYAIPPTERLLAKVRLVKGGYHTRMYSPLSNAVQLRPQSPPEVTPAPAGGGLTQGETAGAAGELDQGGRHANG